MLLKKLLIFCLFDTGDVGGAAKIELSRNNEHQLFFWYFKGKNRQFLLFFVTNGGRGRHLFSFLEKTTYERNISCKHP